MRDSQHGTRRVAAGLLLVPAVAALPGASTPDPAADRGARELLHPTAAEVRADSQAEARYRSRPGNLRIRLPALAATCDAASQFEEALRLVEDLV